VYKSFDDEKRNMIFFNIIKELTSSELGGMISLLRFEARKVFLLQRFRSN